MTCTIVGLIVSCSGVMTPLAPADAVALLAQHQYVMQGPIIEERNVTQTYDPSWPFTPEQRRENVTVKPLSPPWEMRTYAGRRGAYGLGQTGHAGRGVANGSRVRGK